METKLFEVRDRMTFIPVICIKCNPDNLAERYLLAMSGYGVMAEKQSQVVLMGRLNELNFVDLPVCHPGYPGVRTLPEAHKYIIKHWEEIQTGAVVDVEFILGEVEVAKITQRLEAC